MSKFDKLTQYIIPLESDNFGDWIIDKENDGTPEHPIHFPFVNYSQLVDSFHNDLYAFCDEHPEYEHTRYGDTLKINNIE